MADINTVCLTGRLTRQAEIRYSQSGGGAIVRFSLAVNRRKRTADGQGWEDEANFFDCVYFGRAAEAVNQYLEKGRQVAISGELRQSKWEQDGQQRSKVEIAVSNLSLVGGRGSEGTAYPAGNAPYQAAGQSQRPQYGQGQGTGTRPSGAAGAQQPYAQPSQNRFSGSFSRAGQSSSAPVDDFSVGGPESYGDDDVPF